MKPLLNFAGFCARHLFALFVTVTVACVGWTIVYFALFLWAAFSGGGMGGPLAYPAGLLFVLVAATLAGLALFLPAVGLAELVARRFSLPILVQIPMSLGFFAVICFVFDCIAHGLRHGPVTLRGFTVGLGLLFFVNLLPLGLYWWTAQIGPMVLSIVRRLWPGGHL